MRQLLPILLYLLFALGNTFAESPICQIEHAEFRGWNTLKLSNGLVSLYVAPDIGGRVIQFQLGDHPFFFVNSELAGRVFPSEENGGDKGGWKNYGGSKLWPAPQGWERDDQWPGPPDPVLDGGVYRGEITQRDTDRVAVRVTSPPDSRTGIQLSRTISLFSGGTQVRHDCVMKNISRRPVRWAIWEVVQHDTAMNRPLNPALSTDGGEGEVNGQGERKFNDDFWAYCPLNPRSAHLKGFSPLFGQATHGSWRPDYERGLLAVKYDYRVGKVGLDCSAGWLAVVNGQSDHCFIGRFTHVPNATYPDHANVEFWLNGAGEFILNGASFTNAPDPKETPYFMESEILSPLADLQPGEEYRFTIDWFATRCPRPILEVTSVGAVNQRLKATQQSGQVKLEGVYGVFFKGMAEAVFKDASGSIVGRESLGSIEPNQVFRLSRSLPLPEKAHRVTVVLLDGDGENRGMLGNTAL